MHPRSPAATFLVAVASLLLLPAGLAACSGDEPHVARDAAASTSATPAPSTTASAAAASPLAGTWSTPPIRVARMAHVARQAGFGQADVDDFLADLRDVEQVVFTLKLTDDFWLVFETRDDGSPEDAWSGPYEILDGSTVRAGEPPCGPVTYDYQVSGDDLSLKMTKNDCIEGGITPPGELIAQTVLYQSAPYHRLD